MPRVAYAQDGSLLRAAGCVLGIGPRATCTALLFLHRYHAALRGLEPAAASASAVDDLVAVCLYSAAKVEEVRCCRTFCEYFGAVLAAASNSCIIATRACLSISFNFYN